MRHDLACLCVVGGLLVAGVTEGRAPAPAAVLDKETAAEVRKLQEKRRGLLRERWRCARSYIMRLAPR